MKKLTDVSKMTRDEVVPHYRSLLAQNKENPFSDEVVRVNQLILTKWKPSGLEYIKNKAWML